jgi:hypothetical protein
MGRLRVASGHGTFSSVARLSQRCAALAILLLTCDAALAENPPTVTLLGDNPQFILQGDPYVEQGATASDPEDGDLTDSIVITGVGSIDTNVPDDYIVTYTVTDSDDNTTAVTRTVTVTPNNPPSITLQGPNPQSILQGDPYVEQGATASDPEDGDLTDSIVITGVGSIDTNVPDDYIVTYTVTDSDDNTTAVTRTVTVTPNNPPSITLQGPNPQSILQGDPYVEQGATASDPEDGDLTDSIVITGVGSIDTNVPDDYIVTYTVTDSDDNTTAVTRTVTVTPNNPPSITLQGPNPQSILQGDPYVEQGATASDPEDGDLTDSIVITGVGSIDTNVPDDYIVTYTVTDSDDNTTAVTRTVTVTPNNPPSITLQGPNPQSILQGDPYVEQGATASDPEDGDLTDSIVITGVGSIDTNVPDDYIVTYTVTDSDDNTTAVTRTVTVTPNNPPSITLQGPNPQSILQGDPYVEQGATASDPEDGDLTDSIVITGVGSIDTNVPDDYIVTYTVTDSDDNTTAVTRTVTVTPNNPPSITLQGPNPQSILQGDPYVEQGATASDPEDGDLTDSIVITGVGSIDTNVPDDYIVTYTVTDSDDNTTAVTRTVTVTPNNPPQFTVRPLSRSVRTSSTPTTSSSKIRMIRP